MPKIIYSNTKDSNIYSILRMDIPDKFLYLDTGRGEYVFLDHREIGVFEEKNKNKDIKAVLLDSITKNLSNDDAGETREQKIIYKILQDYNLLGEVIEVPDNLSLDIVDFLRSRDVRLKVNMNFCPEREIKKNKDIAEIKESLKCNYKAFERIENILENSKVTGDYLKYKGDFLTSEYLKYEVEKILLKEDMVCSEGLVISSGKQTAIPHHSGSGRIMANSPIICDIFPRSRKSGYFADMTRTYVVGEAGDKFRGMYEAVLRAQTKAIDALKPGIKAKDIHEICVKEFLNSGFDVGDIGFVHGTGHGLGFDIHEQPFINSSSEYILRPGNVFTVEPGLYYPDIGGVRIEDDILITEDGYLNLVDYNKQLINR